MTELSRRGLLAALVPHAKRAVGEAVERRIERHFPPERRPPGAVREALFLSLCTGCKACAEACPHAAIYLYDETAGIRAKTPVLFPDERPCHMCDGFPCAAACPEQALQMPSDRTVKLGTVRLATERCIAFAGPECGACVGLCPGGSQALKLVRWRPELNPEQCTGCGLCIEACPTLPPALELEPLVPHTSDQ